MWKSLWIRVAFPLVIHSGMSAFSRDLFISVASLSLLVVNFLTRFHVCHHGPEFSNLQFLSDDLSESRYTFAFRFSSSACNSFFMLFPFCFLIRSLYYYFLLQNCFFTLVFGSGYVFRLFPLLVGKIFFGCFWMSCSVFIVWSYLDIFLVFFLSPVLSDLSPRMILFVLVVLIILFSSEDILAFFVRFSIFACCPSFLICVFSRISHLGFVWLLVLFKITPIFHRQISLLHRLDRSILWWCLLTFM